MDKIKSYTVRGYRGIAFSFAGYPKRWEPNYSIAENDDGSYDQIDTGEGEWVEDPDCGRVIMVMVGDDRKHEVDESDCTEISEDDYCGGCGQIGCTAEKG